MVTNQLIILGVMVVLYFFVVGVWVWILLRKTRAELRHLHKRGCVRCGTPRGAHLFCPRCGYPTRYGLTPREINELGQP